MQYYDDFRGTCWRYGSVLRPFNQLNLGRLEYLPGSDKLDDRFHFGTAAFAREMTDFEVNQFDLTLVEKEER